MAATQNSHGRNVFPVGRIEWVAMLVLEGIPIT